MNVIKYDKTARGINAPMYDYYAKKIKEKAGITRGVCIDAGSSGGYLGAGPCQDYRAVVCFYGYCPSEALERGEVAYY